MSAELFSCTVLQIKGQGDVLDSTCAKADPSLRRIMACICILMGVEVIWKKLVLIDLNNETLSFTKKLSQIILNILQFISSCPRSENSENLGASEMDLSCTM